MDDAIDILKNYTPLEIKDSIDYIINNIEDNNNYISEAISILENLKDAHEDISDKYDTLLSEYETLKEKYNKIAFNENIGI